MSTVSIVYEISIPKHEDKTFALELDERTFVRVDPPMAPPPDWVKLSFHQCSNCPLSNDNHLMCPLALRLVDVVEYGNSLASYQKVHVTVTTSQRSITKNTTAQAALSSLMGLISATSDCPHTRFLRPMARFHLPFADNQETVYRIVSMYLLGQYFSHKRDEPFDYALEELEARYQDLHTLNLYIAKRLISVAVEDSAINALTKLDTFSLVLTREIRDSLRKLEPLFYQEPDGT